MGVDGAAGQVAAAGAGLLATSAALASLRRTSANSPTPPMSPTARHRPQLPDPPPRQHPCRVPRTPRHVRTGLWTARESTKTRQQILTHAPRAVSYTHLTLPTIL